MVAAYDAQQARLVPSDGDAWANLAGFFKLDPKRPLDAVLTKIAAYLRPDDALIDVGGGAGRVSLPLALRCREVVIVDPSAGMRRAFDDAREGSGIENARFVQSGWLEAAGIDGDVALVAHVTYFVPQIVPFIEKLNRATKRRVIVSARSTPPPNQSAPFFRLVHGDEMSRVPGPRELLPVLEELGIAAETVDIGPAEKPATLKIGQTRDEAIQIEVENASRSGGLKAGNEARLAKAIAERFEELFVKTERGFWRRSAVDARDLLITWETR
jgi:hypothetical protein